MIYQIKILLFANSVLSFCFFPIQNKYNKLKINDSKKEHEEITSNNEDTLKEFDKNWGNDNLSVTRIMGEKMHSLLLAKDTNKDNIVTYEEFLEIHQIIFNVNDRIKFSDEDYNKIKNDNVIIKDTMKTFYEQYTIRMKWFSVHLNIEKNNEGCISVEYFRILFSYYGLDEEIQNRILKRLKILDDFVKCDDIIRQLT
ncbi:uncharacterized protein LOC126896002 [Daktulosphaira vitifoliae]|uniref:uncharacterized protein LOC126896002 n=1 Tax=Daktulosphaira vitifoliae TaxID=58002 RepID=UPI0021A97FAA|nr:uncharacterized protein LOC126896002 [Daktulosphaira vitifoliae]XP_050524355.1 uncharacterized protein LOC126896002 [Daktulosphaira vitifoliae]